MGIADAGSFLTLLFAFAAAASAQEVQFIDLTAAPQRVEIRLPPPSPAISSNGIVSGGGGGSGSDCASDVRDPHGVAVYLDGVDGKEIDPVQPFQAEFRFVNTGRLPINIPVSPNRSDLQPPDASDPFGYLSLGLALHIRNKVGSTGYVQLYGAMDHSGTTRVLRPGEWIRVKANLKLNPRPPSCTSLTLVPGFWMHSNQVRATSGGSWEDSHGICVNETPVQSVTIHCERHADSSNQ
jgi:hypothetical protein